MLNMTRARYLFELGHSLREARMAAHATQEELAGRVGLGRTTVNQLEAGVFPDLGVKKVMRLLSAVGLELAVVPSERKISPDYLKMASLSASVSHRESLSPDELASVFLTAKVPGKFRPHLRVIFDELPRSVLEGAIRQVSACCNRPERIRENVRIAANAVGSDLGATP